MAAESIVSAFLPIILDKLISPAIRQICLAFGYDGKLQKLKKIFERIQSVLVDAEERQIADKCNGLVSLPERMEGLTQLKHLEILNCDRLRSLPEGLLRRLPTLRWLKIIGQDMLIRPFKIGGEYWNLIENIHNREIRAT